MDIKYLVEEILPVRAQEIKDGKNAATRQPIYVVLSLTENYSSGHNEFTNTTNLKGIDQENGYLDMDLEGEDREFCESSEGMASPEEVTRFYTDTIAAFFLTRGAAEDYLNYQKHNLNQGYIYAFYSGYGNRQMDRLLNNG